MCLSLSAQGKNLWTECKPSLMTVWIVHSEPLTVVWCLKVLLHYSPVALGWNFGQAFLSATSSRHNLRQTEGCKPSSSGFRPAESKGFTNLVPQGDSKVA